MNEIQVREYASSGGRPMAVKQDYDREKSSQLEAYGPQGLLRSFRASSAGVVVMVSGYGLYVPHFGTSPSVVDIRSFTRPATPTAPLQPSAEPATGLRKVLALSVEDQARELLASLGLNKTQLADVLRVSRPTVYEWLDGKEPNASNANRLSTILQVLASAGVSSSTPLNARFVRQALNARAGSLLEALQAETINEALVAKLLHEAKAIERQAQTRRTAREDRLRGLGFEDPTDEQQRDQLARNVATGAWPKL